MTLAGQQVRLGLIKAGAEHQQVGADPDLGPGTARMLVTKRRVRGGGSSVQADALSLRLIRVDSEAQSSFRWYPPAVNPRPTARAVVCLIGIR